MTRVTLATVAASLVALSFACVAAHAQAVHSATVTSVIDGDTLIAQMADGRQATVRIIGIDAPAARMGIAPECGGAEAKGEMEDLVQGQAVTLTTDPTQPLVDAAGRSLFYVDRVDGLDVGLESIRRGWSAVHVPYDDFQRLSAYRDVEAAAELRDRGVWTACGGDFHLTRAEQLRELRRSAKVFVGRYYRRVSNRQFRAAWGMLGSPVRRKLGSDFGGWRSGYRGSLGVKVLATKTRLSGRRAVVKVRLRSRDRDACSHRVVRQHFRGNVLLAPRGDSWAIVKFRIRKTRGHTPRLSKSQCPAPKPTPPPASDCQGYSPCLPPGPDVDCAGGDGNGPRYVEGPVSVNGSDPYDLDGNDDGIGCED